MNNNHNNKDDDIFHPPDDAFGWDSFDSELTKDNQQTMDKDERHKKEPPIIFDQSAKVFSKLSLRIIIVLIAILGNISAVVINSIYKESPTTVTTSTTKSHTTSETDIAEALSWGTPSNPAFLSDATPEQSQKSTWPNGNIRSAEPIVNGLIDGMGEYNHENGKVYGRIPYLHGQKHGRFNLYFEDGSPDQSLSYKNGVPHGVLTWHKTKESWVYVNGNAIKKIPYQSLQ